MRARGSDSTVWPAYFLSSGIATPPWRTGMRWSRVGRAIRHQAFLLGFSDTIIMQSAVLGLGCDRIARAQSSPSFSRWATP